jgi:carotenoid 1,2-hydratase
VIAFVGSVFSPYYYWARQRDPNTNPENHCAINVAIYGRGVRRWSMTERGRRHVSRDAHHFQVGPSQLRWTGQHLELDLNEWSVPIPQKIRGKIKLFPDQLFHFLSPLDDQQQHHWGPIAPSARVEVELDQPSLSWKGHAYLDSNEGTEPISERFQEWDWSRAQLRDGSVGVLYDVRQKFGDDRLLALRFHSSGQVEPFEAPKRQGLPLGLWRVNRSIRSDDTHPAQVLQTLEDTPFYIRSVLKSGLLNEPVIAMHETLNIPRLDSSITRLMLPWRMPRRG